ILNNEEHVKDIDFLTTLAGYVHWKLTGKRVMGVGEASGMFPIDIENKNYNNNMIEKFNSLISSNKYSWTLEEILPKVLVAGEEAGTLTEKGALLLDPSGRLQVGAKLCPPEGDAGTGMVATNSIAKKTGNVSAGTSAFAMVVLEKELSKLHKELDMVTTPTGDLVAMAHSNNCTSDINAWIEIFNQCLGAFGVKVTPGELYKNLFEKALEGDDDCGDLMSYCFYSGEHGIGLTEGCPMFLHPANSKFNLANFMRVQLYTCFGAMKLGMDILTKEEKVKIDKILGHGGIFKTKGVAQNILSAAIGAPVVVMETAGEGGAWGSALLALYLDKKQENNSLEDFLNNIVFGDTESVTVEPNQNMAIGYEKFIEGYKSGLTIEQEAVNYLRNKA
ncbi:MAG: FGGY-family carbohydrate kinase, partial [Clostridium celatum]|nr:FGGY-family carbohydrate kinase [Clostridium celatum]